MNRTRLTLGGLALAGAASLALAGTASAHPNLAVDTSVSCSGFDFNVTGVDQGTSVTVNTSRTVNGETFTATLNWDYRSGTRHVTLPADFVGTVSSTIESEGKRDEAGGVLDCRTPAPPPPSITPPPPGTPPGTPPPSCGELRVKYPRAGVKFWRDHNCTPPKPPPPPRRKREVCRMPATLHVVQPQRGTIYFETYPIAVSIRNTTGAPTPEGALILTDSGLQNFVTESGDRTQRLVVPIGSMRKGQRRIFRGTMGFVGPEAFKAYFTTHVTFMVNGRRCGSDHDVAFEG